MEFDGKRYASVRGSDIQRDGMYLEVHEADGGARAILEVFYSDAKHRFTLSLFAENVPVELVEMAIATARADLPADREAVDLS